MTKPTTDRRTMLKLGALAAAPIAALAPTGVMAGDDDARARLAVLEDEAAIRDAARRYIAAVNGGNIACDAGISAVTEDAARAPQIMRDDRGTGATYRRACIVERTSAFAGDSTAEKMARFQGHGHHAHREAAMLEARLIRTAHGWQVTALTMA